MIQSNWLRRLQAIPNFPGNNGDQYQNDSNQLSTKGMLINFGVNVGAFLIFLLIFEKSRHWKQIFLKRYIRRYIDAGRIPYPPPSYYFGWLVSLYHIKETDVLRMVGLDAYMCLRFISVCFKLSCFLLFWGLLVLTPIYATAADSAEWSHYTIFNILRGDENIKSRLYATVIFGYIFSAYFCQLLYREYNNFSVRRLQYLVQTTNEHVSTDSENAAISSRFKIPLNTSSDPDTPLQKYYTVMVESIPNHLRSAEAIYNFFDNLFPNEVYSVEVSLDLKDLNQLCAKRKRVRDCIEKAIAYYSATNQRPTAYVNKNGFYLFPEEISASNDSLTIWNILKSISDPQVYGFEQVDAISYYTDLLNSLNDKVKDLQSTTFEKKFDQHILKKDNIHKSRLASVLLSLKNNSTTTKTMKSLFQPLESQDKKKWSIDNFIFGPQPRSFEYEVLKQQKRIAKKDIEAISANLSQPQMQHVLYDYYDPQEEYQEEDSAVLNIIDATRTRHSSDASHEEPDDVIATSKQQSDLRRNLTKSDPNLSSMRILESNAQFRKWRSKSIQQDGPLQIVEESIDLHPKESLEEVPDETDMPHAIENRKLNNIGQEFNNFASIASKAVASDVRSGVFQAGLEAERFFEMLTLGAYYKYSSTAFVTFKSRVTQSVAQQMLISHDSMEINHAPNPHDIIWDNISIPRSQVVIRSVITNIGLVIGSIFWSSLVNSVDSFASLVPLPKYQQQLVSAGIMLILLLLLPLIFDILSRYYEGLKTETEIQNSIMTRYFYYQLINVYVTVGFGNMNMWTQILVILKSPHILVTIVGSTIPAVSLFFANLVILKVFSAVPIEMCRPYQLSTILLVSNCIDKRKTTRRDLRQGAFYAWPMLYGWIYPQLLMVLIIMVTYASIAPLIMPFCVVFFAFAYVMYKYQLLYVYITEYQSGGYMWYAVFNRSLISLLFASLTLLGYFGLQLSDPYASSPFYWFIPLPCCIIYFKYYCEAKFMKQSMNLSLGFAKELDHLANDRKAAGKATPHDTFSRTLYRQPALTEGAIYPEPYRSYWFQGGSANSSNRIGSLSLDVDDFINDQEETDEVLEKYFKEYVLPLSREKSNVYKGHLVNRSIEQGNSTRNPLHEAEEGLVDNAEDIRMRR